jgi:transcriptional regulator with XRE-family HTH domain
MIITIGDKLRLLRYERNITQKEVSLATGLKVDTIGRIENSVDSVRKKSIEKLTNYYGLTIDDLLKN